MCVVCQDANDELKFTELLRHIYRRHANVVPVMAKVCVDPTRWLHVRGKQQ